jgi:FMN phosphatase YigB (HAD superfamily)
MKGIVFDLDETLVDRRGSLNVYAQRLFADFSASITVPEDPFIFEFHRLDGNGRVPRDAFFAALATHLFREVHAQTIKAHFESVAWVKPLLFDGDDPRADIWGAKQVGFSTCWVEHYADWPTDLAHCYDAHVNHTRDCLEEISRAVRRR